MWRERRVKGGLWGIRWGLIYFEVSLRFVLMLREDLGGLKFFKFYFRNVKFVEDFVIRFLGNEEEG